MTRKTRTLQLLEKNRITPNMLRLVFGGEDLHDFPENQESGYVKLRFPLPGEADKFRTRSYTIRTFSAQEQRLTLDFADHGDKGLASPWAIKAQVGDTIAIDGPGPTKLVDNQADWFFLVGDMTSLPAISVNLEQLPKDARGYAVIEVLSEADQQAIDKPENVEIHWVVNSQPEQSKDLLLAATTEKNWLDGEVNVWVACEFDTMRALRNYFKKDRQLNKHQVYASSYWKLGDSDEGNKAAKKLDTEADT